jgi:flavin-dependent dehydrogenase
MRQCDVLVVGAGLAGLWCARLLAQAGLQVTLVDERTGVDRRIRTTGIFVRRTLQDFALPPEGFGPEIRRVVLYSPGLRALPLESPHPEFRVARMGPLLNRLLEQARCAGVVWSPGTRCLGLDLEGPWTIARVSGIRTGPLEARFVIGADGARSRVARWLGLSENQEWIVGLEEVYEGIPLDGPPVLHCVLSPTLAPGYLA